MVKLDVHGFKCQYVRIMDFFESIDNTEQQSIMPLLATLKFLKKFHKGLHLGCILLYDRMSYFDLCRRLYQV